jgi:glycosyltransferase A (GT-A) superfamily protein (DUF2064 family)
VIVMVVAKAPVPGRVKTRLTAAYSAQEAAELAEASLRDTLEAVAGRPARRRIVVLDRTPGLWLPAGFEMLPQAAGGLDERLAAAFGQCDGPTVMIDMDTPQVTAELLERVLAAGACERADADAWFGPAADGGFWALGLARPEPALLRGVPMSRPDTGRLQRPRLTTAGPTERDLPVLRDVDAPAEADAVPAAAPHTRFPAALARVKGLPGPVTAGPGRARPRRAERARYGPAPAAGSGLPAGAGVSVRAGEAG